MQNKLMKMKNGHPFSLFIDHFDLKIKELISGWGEKARKKCT